MQQRSLKIRVVDNGKSSESHYRLIVINGVYTTRHATHSSYIGSMRNNDFNNKIYLERKKCITTSITSFNTLE